MAQRPESSGRNVRSFISENGTRASHICLVKLRDRSTPNDHASGGNKSSGSTGQGEGESKSAAKRQGKGEGKSGDKNRVKSQGTGEQKEGENKVTKEDKDNNGFRRMFESLLPGRGCGCGCGRGRGRGQDLA
jgi:hypothetical protein